MNKLIIIVYRFAIMKSPKSKVKSESQNISENISGSHPSVEIRQEQLITLTNTSPIISPSTKKHLRSRSMERTKKETRLTQKLITFESQNTLPSSLSPIQMMTTTTTATTTASATSSNTTTGDNKTQNLEVRQLSRQSNRRCTSAPRSRDGKRGEETIEDIIEINDDEKQIDFKNNFSVESEKIYESR